MKILAEFKGFAAPGLIIPSALGRPWAMLNCDRKPCSNGGQFDLCWFLLTFRVAFGTCTGFYLKRDDQVLVFRADN